MLNSLKGVLSGKTAGKIFLETGGIEWEVETSYTTVGGLPGTGNPVRIFTYLHHREDQMRLYGFAGEDERSLFLDLLKVNGVGPKQALRILSGSSVDSLVRILEAGDAPSLARIPGLGMKTAQKIILALKGKLSLQEGAADGGEDELTLALADMGFDRKRAAAAIRSLSEELVDQGLSADELEKEVFRRAIIRLSG